MAIIASVFGENEGITEKSRITVFFENLLLTNIKKSDIIPIEIFTMWSFGSCQLQDSIER